MAAYYTEKLFKNLDRSIDRYVPIETCLKITLYTGVDDPKRIIVLASESCLEDLVDFPNWGVDGTFKVVPELWYQLFTIHVYVEHTSVPRVFVLLPDKTQDTYKRMFEILKNLVENVTNGNEFQPESLSTDFEKASLNSISEAYPNASIFCCLFHFCQAHYRKLVDHKLSFLSGKNWHQIVCGTK